MDKELNKLLNTYKIADAGNDLYERIIKNAETAKRTDTREAYSWYLQKVGVLAIVAIIGFGSGNNSLRATAPSLQNATSFDRIIVGPKHYSEVML